MVTNLGKAHWYSALCGTKHALDAEQPQLWGRAFAPIQAFYLSIPTDPSCAAANLCRVPVADASPGMLK